VRSCKKCPLSQGRILAVPGEGPEGAHILLLGEAPGRFEDRTGRPFVGQAGKLLDKALEEAGLRRDEVFITSVVKCRPPNNREPKHEEIESCRAYLNRQIEALKPNVVVALGRVAFAALTGKKGGITRGKVSDLGDIKLVTTYHPAVALHGRPTWFKYIVKDLKRASKLSQ